MNSERPPSAIEDILHQLASDNGIEPEAFVEMLKENSRAIPELDSLRTMLDDMWTWYSEGTLEPTSRQFGITELAAVWRAHAFHQARSALLLERSGLEDSAAVNARTAMEYGIYLSPLGLSQNSRQVVDQLAIKSLRRSHDTLMAIPREDQPEIDMLSRIAFRLIEDDETSGPINAHVLKRVCEKLENGNTIYYHYQILSSIVHPGLGSMLTIDSDQFAAKAGIDFNLAYRSLSLWLAVGGCAWAAWASNRLINPDDFDDHFGERVRHMGFMPLEYANGSEEPHDGVLE